jgi:uncharacterized protein (TIGR00251 family)
VGEADRQGDTAQPGDVAYPDFSGLCEIFKGGVILRVHVQPSARTEGMAGAHGSSLKVRVRAPAVAGKANRALLALLARELGVSPAGLVLVGGANGRDKRVAIAGLNVPEVGERLAEAWRRARGAI